MRTIKTVIMPHIFKKNRFILDLKRFILCECHSHLSEGLRDLRPSKEHCKKYTNLVMNYHNKKFKCRFNNKMKQATQHVK